MCVLTGVAMNLQLLCLKALSISMRKAANIRLHVWGERGFYFRWKDGLYCFDDTPFNLLLGKLEKYYKVKIVVENPKVLNYRCTGKFKDQDGGEHVLKVIQKDHSFIYSISAEKDSIFIK